MSAGILAMIFVNSDSRVGDPVLYHIQVPVKSAELSLEMPCDTDLEPVESDIDKLTLRKIYKLTRNWAHGQMWSLST